MHTLRYSVTMTIIRGLAAAAIFVCAALASAGPAQGQGNGEVKAPGTPEGIYTVNIAGQASRTWTIYPSCVPTVGDLREPLILPVACRLNIQDPGQPGANARQVGFRWTFDYNRSDARTCPDGSKAPLREVYAFDGNTLVGDLQLIYPEGCGEQPHMVTLPMTLTFKEPLPIPVDQYPLICEPGGLRRCF
ncbi:MAG TPA: hypothetical protein VHI10_19735 [Mycobacterium sp.]|nr:hypothetical protein [Mycobacterium sp.]